MNPFKFLIFFIGAAAAALATAMFVGGFDRETPATPDVAAAPSTSAEPDERAPSSQQTTGEPAGNETADAPANGDEPQQSAAATADPSNGMTADPSNGMGENAAAESGAPVLVAPSFDLLRVESGGSIVIAGKAAPSANVEVISGSTTLGTTKAGAGGDFAIVLDAPLKPGEHQLVLRSTSENNVVASSPETAVVSIPDQPGGQVLALVEAPGKPSTLITVPKPKTPAATAPASADADAGGSSGTSTPPAASVTESDGSATETAAATPAQTETSEGASTGSEAAAGAKPKGAAAQVLVEAVEIEGRRVFVAGRAEPGSTVRVYANDVLLGETTATPNGRFLVETERDLKVGDYIVRADVLGRDGAEVLARAAVPFEREAGESISAIAPQPGTPSDASGSATLSGDERDVAEGTTSAPSAAGETTRSGSAAPGQTAAASTDDGSMSAKLEKVQGAVIIRRGDSLWRISRRVYGLGIRYSTIYLANQDQIADPDRIWPGQVFRVPDETGSGEAADMDAIGAQSTTTIVQ